MIEMTLQGWNLLKEVGFTKDGFFYVVDVVDLAQEPRNENRSRCTANHIISIFRPIPESLRVRCCKLWRRSSRTPTKSSPIRRAGEPMRGSGNLWIERYNDPHHYPGSSSRDP